MKRAARKAVKETARRRELPDPGVVARMFHEGVLVREIAEYFEIHRSTVSGLLDQAGVERGRGPQPGETCGRGHDMGEWGRPRPSGGRYCMRCRHENYKAKKAAKKAAEERESDG